ncbi:MAG: glycosyltransferase [Pedobacter sp.]|nr:MAG: glycosyltransferase [Pedobacter sp.]
MSKYPLVSIIIPCYNHERYVQQCLDSVLTDDYHNKEIVIIDDGSTDRSKQVIAEWINTNEAAINVIYRTQKNSGICNTLNNLINYANGEYVAILASDDKLNINGIRERVDYLLKFPDKMVVFGDSIIIDENSIVTHHSSFLLHKGDLRDFETNDGMFDALVVKGWPSPGPVTLVKKDYYRKFGYYPKDLLMEDQFFYLTAIANSVLGYLDKPVAYYRIHSISLSRNPQRKRQVLRDLAKTYFRRMNLFKAKQKTILLLRGLKIYIKSFL